MRLTNSRFFCILYVRMNHFEVHLMVSWRVVDSKVLRMAIQFEYFLLIKRQNGECNARHLRRFLFSTVWVLMYQHWKSALLQVTLDFELEQINISSRHFNSPKIYNITFVILPFSHKDILTKLPSLVLGRLLLLMKPDAL